VCEFIRHPWPYRASWERTRRPQGQQAQLPLNSASARTEARDSLLQGPFRWSFEQAQEVELLQHGVDGGGDIGENGLQVVGSHAEPSALGLLHFP